jgi:hypothetical protein
MNHDYKGLLLSLGTFSLHQRVSLAAELSKLHAVYIETSRTVVLDDYATSLADDLFVGQTPLFDATYGYNGTLHTAVDYETRLVTIVDETEIHGLLEDSAQTVGDTEPAVLAQAEKISDSVKRAIVLVATVIFLGSSTATAEPAAEDYTTNRELTELERGLSLEYGQATPTPFAQAARPDSHVVLAECVADSGSDASASAEPNCSAARPIARPPSWIYIPVARPLWIASTTTPPPPPSPLARPPSWIYIPDARPLRIASTTTPPPLPSPHARPPSLIYIPDARPLRIASTTTPQPQPSPLARTPTVTPTASPNAAPT